MATEEDIAASLPEPPPPAPARREAAIGEAMRRFDGLPERAGTPRPVGKPPRWWTNPSRPQLATAVSVALMAVIGLPVALLTTNQHATLIVPRSLASSDATPSPNSPAERTATPPSPQASAPRPTPGPVEAIPRAEPRPEAEAAPPPPAQLAEADTPSGAPAAKTADSRDAVRAYGMVQPPAVSAPPIVMAPVAPAPPAPAIAAAAPMRADEDVVVTGRRVAAKPAMRGDWNACTVDDPSRDLALCRKLIDPAAPGAEGRAAAHVADGLTHAWSGDEDGAVAAFDQAIAVAPDLPRAYLNRGLANARRGDLQQGIADLDEAIRRAPHAARGYYNRGLLYRRAGDSARAEADEQRAVELDPRYEAVIP